MGLAQQALDGRRCAAPTVSTPLPKLIYFCYFGSMAFVMPFLPIFLEEGLGIAASRVGALLGGARLVGVAAAPLWTLLADALVRRGGGGGGGSDSLWRRWWRENGDLLVPAGASIDRSTTL